MPFKIARKQEDLTNNLAELKKVLEDSNKIEAIKGFAAVSLNKEDREIEDIDCSHQQIIFTTYFTSKADPQATNQNKKNSQVEKNDIKYIAPWYESIQKLNLNGIVFHDGLCKEFIEKYTTVHIQFVKCTLGNFSLNDERFFIYYQYLLKHCPNVEYVLMTDGNDVTFTRDPFEFIESFPDSTLFVGRNHGDLHRQYLLNQGDKVDDFKQVYLAKIPNNFYNQPVYNAGILGGSLTAVIYQLNRMLELFVHCDSANNHNMVVLNFAIYNYWYPKVVRGIRPTVGALFSPKFYQLVFNTFPKFLYKLPKLWKFGDVLSKMKEHDNKNDHFANTENIVTSYPLCSAFRKHEVDSDAYIIHK